MRQQTSPYLRLFCILALVWVGAACGHHAIVQGARLFLTIPSVSPWEDSRLKGIEPSIEKRVLRALIKSPVASRIAKVGVGGDGFIHVAVVKFTTGSVGDRQGSHVATARIAEATVLRAMQAESRLQEVDVFGVLPLASHAGGLQDPIVFSAIVTRRQVQRWLGDSRREAADPDQTLIDELPNVYWNRDFVDRPADSQRAKKRVSDNSQLRSWLLRPLHDEGGGKDPDRLPIVLRGSVTKPRVALTFDDGPHPIFTPLILDLLARYHVKATFFVVGQQAVQFPDLIKRIHDNGHELGNHTYSHTRLTQMPLSSALRELKLTQRILGDLTGEWVRWYRPPGGECTARIVQAARAAGYIPVLWTNNTGDWAAPPVPCIIQRAVKHLRNGSIVLLHCDNIKTVQALPAIIKIIRSQGFEFGTVYDLVWQHGPEYVSAARIPRLTNIRVQQPLRKPPAKVS